MIQMLVNLNERSVTKPSVHKYCRDSVFYEVGFGRRMVNMILLRPEPDRSKKYKSSKKTYPLIMTKKEVEDTLGKGDN